MRQGSRCARALNLSIVIATSLLTSTCIAADSIQLFNGKDLSGWQIELDDPAIDASEAWKVDEGVLRATAVGKGYIRTDVPYSNYKFHVEWRWPKGPGNSGVVLNIVNGDKVWPTGFEAQLRSGEAGDFYLFTRARGVRTLPGEVPPPAGTNRIKRIGPSRENPVGEWNSYDIEVSGDKITLGVNGEEVNHLSDAVPNAGYIGLQTEGTPIEFRNITLTPLAL